MTCGCGESGVQSPHDLRRKTPYLAGRRLPGWRYDLSALTWSLTDVSRAQGVLLGRLADVGLALRDQASLAVLTEDVVKTSGIEGEVLNVESVRSSIARRLGVDIGAVAPVDRHVEGVVEMVFDATLRSSEALTAGRLFGWHAALFPTGYSSMNKIAVGQWRDDANGPMQVVSGPVGRHKVHFQAPPVEALPAETAKFLAWANEETGEPVLVKAGLAHLWFATLHPFDDGNGRIARTVGDLFPARADGSPQRFYSLSAQIQRDRKDYYDVLKRTQKGTLDATGCCRGSSARWRAPSPAHRPRWNSRRRPPRAGYCPSTAIACDGAPVDAMLTASPARCREDIATKGAAPCRVIFPKSTSTTSKT